MNISEPYFLFLGDSNDPLSVKTSCGIALGLAHQAVPSLAGCLEANIKAVSLTNPTVRLGGIYVNSLSLSDEGVAIYCNNISNEFGTPCCDPLRQGAALIVDYIQGLNLK